jgi:hypothetical protein
MKKLKKGFLEYFQPAKVYIEDIEKIYTLFLEVSNEIIIEADGYSFENLNELFSYQKVEINRLLLKISNPYISIDFEPSKISFYSDDDTSVQIGLYEKVKTIIKKRKNWTFSLSTNSFLLGSLIGTSVYPIYLYHKNNEWQYLVGGLLVITVDLVWSYYASIIRYEKYSKLILSYKKENKEPFLKRNKDSIIIAFAFMVFGSIISYMLMN